MLSKVFNTVIALTIFTIPVSAVTIMMAAYFGGLFQSFIVATVVFGICFLITGFYTITRKE